MTLYLEYEEKEKMIRRMNRTRIPCRLNCAFCIPRLKAYGSDIGWVAVMDRRAPVGSKPGVSIRIVLVASVGYTLGY